MDVSFERERPDSGYYLKPYFGSQIIIVHGYLDRWHYLTASRIAAGAAENTTGGGVSANTSN